MSTHFLKSGASNRQLGLFSRLGVHRQPRDTFLKSLVKWILHHMRLLKWLPTRVLMGQEPSDASLISNFNIYSLYFVPFPAKRWFRPMQLTSIITHSGLHLLTTQIFEGQFNLHASLSKVHLIWITSRSSTIKAQLLSCLIMGSVFEEHHSSFLPPLLPGGKQTKQEILELPAWRRLNDTSAGNLFRMNVASGATDALSFWTCRDQYGEAGRS